MEYREIVSVTGMGGLFQLVGSKKDGAIVRNLADNTTKFIPARLHNVTPLESIEIYTTGDNVRLHNVLQQMKDSTVARPDAKKASNDEIKQYFKEIYPDLDEDRVYASDMKKMLKWFDLLQGADLLNFEALEEQPAEDVQSIEPVEAIATDEMPDTTEETATETPAPKKSRAKKSADEDAAAEGEEKPKKTARKKKTVEEGEAGEATEKPAKKTAAKKKEEE